MTTIWDYSGIVAAAYDRYFGAEPYWDQTFYAGRLAANGGRSLEIGCGSGRLLLPLLRDGHEVEGLDTSPEMLERLRARSRAMNLCPVLHQAPMQAFDLPQRFRTVFVPATSFGILVEPAEIRAALACFWRALDAGGELLLPVSEADANDEPIADWRERRNVHVPEYGAQVLVHERTAYEADGRIQQWFLRYTVDRQGRPRATFFREHRLRHHRPDEFHALLAAAGLEAIEMRRGYTDLQSSDPADDLVFSARRPSGR